MLTQQIIDYVNLKKSQGQTHDQIRQELIISGWTSEQADEIDQLFVSDNTSTQKISTLTKTSHRRLPKVLLGLLATLLLATVAIFLPAYLVAYGKLTLPNAQLNSKVKNFVLSLPLVPKTPETLLALVSDNLSKNTSNDFDFSIALALPESLIGEYLPTRNLDISVTGFSEYSEISKPKGEAVVKVNQDFEIAVISTGDTQFFNLKKYPLMITPVLSLFGVDPQVFRENFIDKWFSFDASQLDTPARSELSALPTPTPRTDIKLIEKKLQDILTNKILPKTTLSRQSVDNQSVFRLTFSPDADTIDLLMTDLQDALQFETLNSATDSLTSSSSEQKISDYIKNLSLDVDISTATYQISQIKAVFDIYFTDFGYSLDSSDINTSDPEIIKVVVVSKLTNYNSAKTITTPSDSQPVQEALEVLLSQAGESGGLINPTRQLAQVRNAKRRSDINIIRYSLEQYSADNLGKLPSGLNTIPLTVSSNGADICAALVPNYISAMPVDPEVNNGIAVTDCGSTYNTGYQVSADTNSGKITVSAPFAELDEIISTNL